MMIKSFLQIQKETLILTKEGNVKVFLPQSGDLDSVHSQMGSATKPKRWIFH